MKKYIAFLRGINVGNIRIKMSDLKTTFERLGCQDVTTYLQTGNVVFTSDKTLAELKPILESGLTQTFDYQAFVLLYDFDLLADIINKYPFERVETHHAYVLFVENAPTFRELKMLAESVGEESKRIKLGDNHVIYWQVERGESLSTPFAKIMAKAKFKGTTTVRNVNTLEKMVENG